MLLNRAAVQPDQGPREYAKAAHLSACGVTYQLDVTLRQEVFTAGRLHVGTLMKQMGIEALYRKPNTSKPAPGQKIHPYLLRKLAVRPNQVRAMDITYIPMARGFVCSLTSLQLKVIKVAGATEDAPGQTTLVQRAG